MDDKNANNTDEQNKAQQWVQPREQLDSMDDVVDEIVTEEADKLISIEDRARARSFDPPTTKKNIRQHIAQFFSTWWQNTRLRYGTLIGLFIIFVASILIPFSRYAILNTFGIRVSASMVVVDSESGLPLKNIPVQLQGLEARTNDDGYVAFEGLKQGSTTIKINKLGFAPYEKNVTLGWGSNPLDNQSILVTGARFNFVLKDWLSDEVIKNTEAISGDSVGQADDDGLIELVVGNAENENTVTLHAEGYRDEVMQLQDLSDGDNTVKMVVAKKHPFVSNRNGEYDLYAIDADGKNEKLLLEATRKEREIPHVVPHPTKDVVAFVSSRDGDTNKDGYVLDGLFVIDAISEEVYKVTRSEQIQVVGWHDGKLIYVAVVEGVSAGNSQRSKIVSFDLESKQRTDLATANYFNDVKLLDDKVYYAVSSYAVPRSQAKLFTVGVDGANKTTLIDEQVWSIVRQDYSTILFNTEANGWYEQKQNQDIAKLETQPVRTDSRVYANSPDGMFASWVDVRDGKGVLLVHNVSENKETIRLSASGLSDPVYWIDSSHVVYRVSTTSETADYILHMTTGDTQKIADVIGNRSRYFY
jgi:hypothetical protein